MYKKYGKKTFIINLKSKKKIISSEIQITSRLQQDKSLVENPSISARRLYYKVETKIYITTKFLRIIFIYLLFTDLFGLTYGLKTKYVTTESKIYKSCMVYTLTLAKLI